MPSLHARGTGIDMQKVECLVILYSQYMGMPGNKKLWRRGIEQTAHRWVVMSGIAAYVLDEDIDILTPEAVQFMIHQAQVATVAVAADSPEGSELSQFLCHFERANISRMPDFVAGFEIMQILGIPVGMRVA